MGRYTWLIGEPVRPITLEDLEPFEEITEWAGDDDPLHIAEDGFEE